MKSETALWFSFFTSCGKECRVSTTRDIDYASRRIEKEGFSFLTITLPRFCQYFERSLDEGKVILDPSFRKKGRTGLPAFMSGFLGLLFYPESGLLRDDADPFVVQTIRQILLMFSKIDIPCSPDRVNKALKDYITTDKEVQDFEIEESLLSDFSRISSLVFGPLLCSVDEDVYYGKILPKHGPGVVADGLSQNEKWSNTTWTDRLESTFPFSWYSLPREDYVLSVDPTYLSPEQEPPVRVITVPKTQKGPRIIAIEPSWMQYIQQGLMVAIRDSIEGSYLRSIIGWMDAKPNQLLARQGSLDKSSSTLDLSEASDRVPIILVSKLLANHRHLHDAVFACRSETADVAGDVISLAKFASMGSALTFPLETMVFFTVVLVGMERAGFHLSTKSIKDLRGVVRVYGDDIIVPSRYYESVSRYLELFGFKVNVHKSFNGISFRESCGKEYFRGCDVTVARLRRPLPPNRQYSREVASMVSFRNQLYERGFWRFLSSFDDKIRNTLRVFPIVDATSQALSRHSFLGYRSERMDMETQAPRVRALVLSSKSPRDPLDDFGAFLKFLLGGSSPEDKEHLERAGRPLSAFVKERWVSPF